MKLDEDNTIGEARLPVYRYSLLSEGSQDSASHALEQTVEQTIKPIIEQTVEPVEISLEPTLVARRVRLGRQTSFDWEWTGGNLNRTADIRLQVPGRHNVLNALAAATVGLQLGVDSEAIAQGLWAFRGATSRQDLLGERRLRPDDAATVLVMDDYAHHPTEIDVTLEALRNAYPERRLVAIFQPHLYSRTRDFLDQFASSLAKADLLIVTDIYAAREAPIPGIDAASIVNRVKQRNPALSAHYIADRHTIPAALVTDNLAQPGDLCLFLGAGDIREQAEEFMQNLTDGSKIRRRRIAVLMGGTSSEREISLSTGRMIASALDPQKYDVLAIDTQDLLSLASSERHPALPAPATDDSVVVTAQITATEARNDTVLVTTQPAAAQITTTDAGSDIEPMNRDVDITVDVTVDTTTAPDLVFIALHGRGGEDGAVQGLLEVLRLPYTGSGVLASALAMDKRMSKRLFRGEGIPVAAEIALRRGPSLSFDALIARVEQELGGFPVFVKPNAEGSTVGGTLVTESERLADAVTHAFRYDELVLVERYLRGMEITVGILGNAGSELQALPVVEIVPKSAFYDFESKYADGGSDHIIPARLTAELTIRVQALARQCHELLGCRCMSRTDFIVTADGPYVLEVNTIPGMTPTSLLPQAAAVAGITFPDLLDRIIADAT